MDREIRTGESQLYAITLRTGEFLHLSGAARAKVDLSLQLVQPGGAVLAEADRLKDEGVEDIFSIAAADSDYTVRVTGKTGSGSYRLEAQVRAPNAQDRECASAYAKGWVETNALAGKTGEASQRARKDKLEASLPAWKACGDRRWEAHTLYELGMVSQALRENRRARELLQQSLDLRRNLDEAKELSYTLNNLALVLSDLGETREAIGMFDEAIALRRKLGDRRGEGVALNNLGNTYRRLAEMEKAESMLEAALAIRREVGDRFGEATTLSNLGVIHLVRAQFQKAMENAVDSLKIRIEIGDKRGEASSNGAVGTAYFELGEYRKAEEYWDRSAKGYEAVHDKSGMALMLHNLGTARRNAKDFDGGLSSYQKALALRREASAPLEEANTLAAICRLRLERKQFQEAEEDGQQALAVSRRISHSFGIGDALFCLGRVSQESGNTGLAKERLGEAAATFAKTNSRDVESMVLANLADVESGAGDLPQSLQHIEQASALAEAGRAEVADGELRATFRAKQADRIALHTDVLMKMHGVEPRAGYDVQAFNLTEQSRARSLLESIGVGRGELRRELNEEQRLREDRIFKKVNAIQHDLFQEGLTRPRKSEFEKQLSEAESELDLFRIELARSGSRYGFAQLADVLDEKRVRQELLSNDSALIEYAIGEKRSYGWALTRAGFTSAVLPGRREIEERVDAYRRLLVVPVNTLTAVAAMARADAEGKKLYQILVAPFAAALASKTRVIIVPDGGLSYVPFEVLPGASRLIEQYNISYVPSASILAALKTRDRQRRTPERSLLAFADPALAGVQNVTPVLTAYRERGLPLTRLPSARLEVAGIRSLFQPAASQVYVGEQAREQTVKTEKLESFRYLHFAAHGYFDDEEPSRSGIVLSQQGDPGNDGILQAAEIMRLRLNADLVTLSACQSGLGKILAGEGVMGLSRAFFYAGTQSLVVSLWNVNDAATAELMKNFYANLKAGMGRDEALRKAKLSLMSSPNRSWRNPYFWAPFVFVGLAGQ